MLKQLLVTSVLGFASIVPAFADDAEDGPGRGVARISVINGDVSVRRGDSGDVIAAAINSPLVVQDRMLTGPASRAEVQFDWANMIRMSRETEIRLAELEHKRYIVQIARGTVTFRVLRDQDADIELSTPSVSVRPVKKGEYRITVLEDGTSEITVRSGEAEVYTPKGSERLKGGRTMLARGTAAEPEFQFVSELREDDWDGWNERRDKDLSRSRSYSYVSQDIYGADDLDDHGQWVNVNSYGMVWSPRVAPGWAPYRHGRWSWIDYYGWSWVSHDPWGWAPYHYGRWFYSSPVGWCWWPGARYSRHYWSPALVAFLGFGNVRVGLGYGSIGWVPLAPYERYHRWYGRGYYGGYRDRNYVGNNVRIVNNVNITNVYRNSRIDRAVTGIDHDGFSRGRAGNPIRVRDGEFSRGNAFEGRLPMTPGRESLRLADREPGVRSVASRDDARFFSRRQPAAVDRVPFEDQRRGIEQVARRTFGEEPSRADRATALGERTGDNDASRGWRRVGETPRIGGEASGRTERSNDGWRRFGSPRVETPTVTGGDGGGRDSRASQFGQPGEAGGRTAERTADRGSDWRGFSNRTERTERADRSEGSSMSGRSERAAPRTPDQPRMEQPRAERQESPRVERRNDFDRGSAARGGGDSVRISPPIVRERSERAAPRMESGGSGPPRGGGGGGDRGGDRGGSARGGGGRGR